MASTRPAHNPRLIVPDPLLGDSAAWGGGWIGPGENLLSDPLPGMGAWIAPPTHVSGAGEVELRGTLHLPDGYPRCFGLAWLAAPASCRLLLNGQPMPPPEAPPETPPETSEADASVNPDIPVAVCLSWDKLRRGENTLSIVGPAEAMVRGVSLLARAHEAVSGYHTLASGADWTCDGAPVVVMDRPAPQVPQDNGPRRSVELRRTFELSKVPARARVYVTGLGTYELFINGRRVGDELLAPGWTDFDRTVHYAAHDVTPLLRAGTNECRAVLGNGWWSSGMGWQSLARTARPGDPLRLRLRLDTSDTPPPEVSEGATPLRTTLVTDEQWVWRPSSVLRDTIYHGQETDLNRPAEAWRPAVMLSDAFAPRLLPMPAEPIRVTQTLTATSIRKTPGSHSGSSSGGGGDSGGGWLFDFGQNHAGRPRLRGVFPAGTRLVVRHCEELDAKGEPYFENYRTAAVTDTLVTGSEPVDFAPAFTYRGYRYALLSGLPAGVTPTEATLCSEVLHNDVPSASRFACGNERFNGIDRILRWGLRSNLHSVPTDCPQRDERLGWTGDVQLFARTSCWLMDLRNFYRKWIDDLLAAQLPDGGITHVAPFSSVIPVEAAPVWGDIITVLPRVMHTFYGDAEVLGRTYDAMARWMGWYEARAKDGLALVGGFGDWVSVEPTPPELCGAAYYAYSSRLMGETARLLGKAADAERYAAQAARAAAAYHRHYFDEASGRYEPDTQTAHALPLAFDLTPPELRQSVADHMAALVEARDAKPTTGFVGTAYLLPVLSRFGHHELACRVLDTDGYPSLGYMLARGATTVWERWNSDKEGPHMNSRNHFCLGAMAQWLYEDLVGLRPDESEPGFGRVVIAPRPAGVVRWAEFDYDSPRGPIHTRWEVEGGELHVHVSLPPGVTARLRMPGFDADGTPRSTEQALDAGQHHVRGAYP